MLFIIMILYPCLATAKWNYRMVFVVLILGVSLWIPHIYGTYKTHGDPLYTVNQYTRFYANREFAGKPGFPAKEAIIQKGIYEKLLLLCCPYRCRVFHYSEKGLPNPRGIEFVIHSLCLLHWSRCLSPFSIFHPFHPLIFHFDHDNH